MRVESPVQTAREAHLRYVSDETAGITRQVAGRGFRYVTARGRAVRDEGTLARIRSLAIPPAWKEVWICPDPRGHLQATGRDDRHRKQYRYHPAFRETRDQGKFGKMLDFARALPRIRAAVKRDMARPGLPREKVLGTIVALLERTLIRVGNDEYARENRSYGLTTLRDRHAAVRGGRIRFRFRGKHGIETDVELTDAKLAEIVKACQELPNQELFAYVDEEGGWRDVKSEDVNEYLREVTGEEFTAKDFRTWAGTVLAARALEELRRQRKEGEGVSGRQRKADVKAAVARVAERLNNTAAVCRKCYIHPGIIEGYLAGTLKLGRRGRRAVELAGLKAEEVGVVGFLEKGSFKDF